MTRRRRCARCGWEREDHGQLYAIDRGLPCHRYEPPAPLWLRVVNFLTGGVYR